MDNKYYYDLISTMAYHITRPEALDPNKVVYYTGGEKWSDNVSLKKSYSTKAKASAVILNPDGKNGGFKNATVVSG